MSFPLGIYLGTENVDVVSLSGTFQHPKLLTFARTKLPAESNWRNQLRVEGPEGAGQPTPGSPEALQPIARVIQAILPKLGVTSPQAYVALPSEAVVIRYFQMPAIPAHERKMAIAFEAKKYLPFKLEELISDYEVVIRRSDPALMRVMFFGARRSSIETYLSIFQSAGVTSLCLEPAPLSLMRLVRHTGQLGAGQVAALLYVEHDSATISIARSDILYLCRNVSILPTSEGGEDPSPDLLQALVNETRVSIDYYRRRFLGELPVNKILFFGKTIDPKKAAELSEALDLPVETADPFAKILGAKAVPPGLAVSAGLALRALDKKPKEINLLPEERRRQAAGLLKPLAWEAAAAVLALAVWYGFSAADLNGMEQHLSALKAQISWPGGIPKNAGLAELRQLKGSRDQEGQLLKNLLDRSVQPSQLLSALSKQMPGETWLQYLLFRDSYEADDPAHRRFLHLIGNAYAADRDTELERVNQVLAALRQDPLCHRAFKEFSLDSVQRTQFKDEDVTEFLLTCATQAKDIRRESGRSTGTRGRR